MALLLTGASKALAAARSCAAAAASSSATAFGSTRTYTTPVFITDVDEAPTHPCALQSDIVCQVAWFFCGGSHGLTTQGLPWHHGHVMQHADGVVHVVLACVPVAAQDFMAASRAMRMQHVLDPVLMRSTVHAWQLGLDPVMHRTPTQASAKGLVLVCGTRRMRAYMQGTCQLPCMDLCEHSAARTLTHSHMLTVPQLQLTYPMCVIISLHLQTTQLCSSQSVWCTSGEWLLVAVVASIAMCRCLWGPATAPRWHLDFHASRS